MQELFFGLGNVLIYFLIAVIIVFTLRSLIHIYDELFRKMLHFVLLGSLLVWTLSFETWWLEELTVIGFVIVVYPILMFFEHFKSFSSFTTERKKGELKNSLIVVFLMFALVVFIAEGIFSDRYLAIASVYVWGVGDAFAALIGKPFGKHKIKGKFLSGKKSCEGCAAMFLSSFLAVLIILLIRGGLEALPIVIISLFTAFVSTVCELYTKDGYDTITCPLLSLSVLIPLLYLFGGL